ncbi:MAG: dTMP kinase [Phycisphaerales bacterium]|nr:MAG: dTMP kinase [Phycisphaerales bacterium]
MKSQHWMRQLGGRFLVFDGPDGSGKSTQFSRFADYCRSGGLTVCEVREPGGTDIGEQIRTILLKPANHDMALRCEMMLYMASRAQLVEQIVRPALESGQLVLADRFISSTLAYQGAAGGMSEEEILAVGRVAIGSIWPDLTVIFDVDEKVAAKRLGGSGRYHRRTTVVEPTLFSDRMEQKGDAYWRRVREGFLAQAGAAPDKHLVLDASVDADEVFDNLIQRLADHFSK